MREAGDESQQMAQENAPKNYYQLITKFQLRHMGNDANADKSYYTWKWNRCIQT